uniref:RBPJ-interacting and tubulin-associated protein n=1 Tax=Schistocephalus solidus TaxID=70667 RepID=A0A183SPE9_SCHSO
LALPPDHAVGSVCVSSGWPVDWESDGDGSSISPDQVWWDAQRRLRSCQPPVPSPISGLLDCVLTPGSGVKTQARRPEAGEDAGGWRSRSHPSENQHTWLGSNGVGVPKGHIKKEPLQPDTQSASKPLHTKHTIGLTTRSELYRQLATFQATAFSAP